VVDALVQTKLVLPRLRRALVERTRLTEKLDQSRGAPLVLVSAPAGFGKTTLLTAAWGEGAPRTTGRGAVAWVSLDARDGDAPRFWAYVLRALDGASPGCATAALSQLDSGRDPLEGVITSFINELSVRVDDITLVLDDYHLADTAEVGGSLRFLVDHLPQQLHLVISTRADPTLPLARLRARGELVEIRAADLRFTADEAASYLNTVHALGLSAHDVEALESRTEGWVAALQLAALSLHGRDDMTSFITSFAGDDRFVVDYLVDEVLDQQPLALRRFLLDTSVLDRLCGPLCDAVTASSDGATTLETLERRNLLLVPLDNQRQWYRYHHLFADVLHARLLAERPEDVPVLHRRASDWYEHAGHLEPAVRHAFAANDVDLAADLIEVAAPALRRRRAEGTLLDWVAQVPTSALARRPVLAGTFIGALMASNVFEGVQDRLDALESSLSAPPRDQVIRNHAEWERLPAFIATQRSGLALVAGDLEATITHAETALARAAPHDGLTVASASALKGLASWSAGDLTSAHASYVAATQGLASVGYISDVLGCTVNVVDLAVQLGRLDDADRSARFAVDLVATGDVDVGSGGEPNVRGTADMWLALSQVAWERGDTPAAETLIDRAAQLGETAALPQHPHRWRVAMAQLRVAQGDLSSADVLLEEAERLFNSDFAPVARPIPAIRARLHIRTGDLAAARTWAHGAGIAVTADVTYLREFELITLARLLLAEHGAMRNRTGTHLAQAQDLLGRLHESAEDGERTAVVLETRILQACAGDMAQRTDDAVGWLRQAVAVARPRGWVRPFLEEGPRVRELLTLLPGHEAAFVLDIEDTPTLHHQPVHEPRATGPGPATEASVPPASEAAPALVAPLSARELDVLRLLASDLDGPDIARHLNVSLPTVRTHTQHIYAKLGVNNRRAAVRRGHQLNL
jgi:LuxR family transcriptional regulator, maltose regulon positive regulatory protein